MTRSFISFSIESLESRRMLSANSYFEEDLVSDGAVPDASHTDPNLVNPWGLVANPRGFQIADNGTGLSADYDASGNRLGPTVRVPGNDSKQGAPTGIVLSSNADKFLINDGSGGQVPAQFIYVTENGTIDAWNSRNHNRTVRLAVDRSADGAVYKGVALANFRKKPFLYVANFASGRVDVFNSSFARARLPGKFADPNLPAAFAPFNVQQINGQLFVAYAQRESGGTDEVHGAGLGLVDIFGTDGKLVRRFTTGGMLDAPWGLALAPANFGQFSNDILVGNFGDGKMTAFDPASGAALGQISDSGGKAIAIDGLWGIAFGNGKGGTLRNALYFTAGVQDENHGLYGRVRVDPPPAPPPNPYPMAMTSPTMDVSAAFVTHH